MNNPASSPSPRTSVLNDPKVRGGVFQVLAIAAVVAIGWYLFHNTQSNLAQRGITSGFDFLDRSAGFGILQSLVPYTESDTYGRVFLVGLLNTLLVAVLGVVLAIGAAIVLINAFVDALRAAMDPRLRDAQA